MSAKIHTMVNTGHAMSESAIREAIAAAGDESFHDAIESVEVVCGEYPDDGVAGYAVFEVPHQIVQGMDTEVRWYLSAAIMNVLGSEPDYEVIDTTIEDSCEHEEVEMYDDAPVEGGMVRCADCGKFL